MRAPPTLRGLLLRRLLIPLAAVWLLGAGVAYYFAERFSNLAYDRALFDSARSLAAQVELGGNRVTLDLPKEAEQILLYDEHDTVYYQVKTAEGEMIAGDDAIPAPPAELASISHPIYYDSRLHGNKVRIAALFRSIGDNPEKHTVVVQVAETLSKRRILAEEILTGIVLPQLILIVLAAFSIWYGVSKGLLPLNRLQVAISNRSHRDLSAIPEERIPAEIQPLIRSINELMARLSEAMLSQQRFIADASHQLRTPLAGLHAQVELALRQADHDDMRHTLHQIFISAERASHLAKQLLILAQAEPDITRNENFRVLNLTALARDVTKEWVFAARKKNIDLGFEAGDDFLMIRGHAFLVETLLGNLIDNAIKYTPPGGRITVTARRDGMPCLSVEDNGPGIAPEDRERVFDRFYRVLGTDVDGSGLGLAIAREITLSHSGDIHVAASKGGGTAVIVRFPAVNS